MSSSSAPSTSTNRPATPSLLSPIGYRSSSCGYCKGKRGGPSGSRSYYAIAERLSTPFYQALICRGWRRSGTLLYKPDLKNSCCPHYTIRLDSLEFRATRDQRQAQNRFNRYILGDDYVRENARLHPKSKAEAARYKQEFDLCQRVHESERDTLKTPPEPAHELKVTLEPDTFTEEKFQLFENYQRVVHKESPDSITRSGLKRFLCSSPLQRSTATINGKEQKLGSYHQCYRVDGRLLAIGVLDLLPQAVSAVYFMYNEELHKWSSGKLSALREAALAVEGGYRWYMMGFYIHSCIKMRYKGDYHPQFLLDPETYAWDPLDHDLRSRLDVRPYVCMSAERRDAVPAPSKEEVAAATSAAEAMDATSTDIPSDDEAEEPDDVPIFAKDMPGIMARSDLAKFDLGSVRLSLRGRLARCRDLVIWASSSIDDPTDIKGAIAELAAALGPDLVKDMIVSF